MKIFRTLSIIAACAFVSLAPSAFSAANILIYANGGWVLQENVSPRYENCTNFGTIYEAGNMTKDYAYYIRNTGDANLTVNSVNITGTGAGQFSVTQGPDASIPANDFSSFVVSYTPTSQGTHNAKITVGTNAPSNALFEFNISGRADNTANLNKPDLSISPITLVKSKIIEKKGVSYLKAQYIVPVTNSSVQATEKKVPVLRVLAGTTTLRTSADIAAAKVFPVKLPVTVGESVQVKVKVKLELPPNPQRIIFELLTPDDYEPRYSNNMRFETVP